ncbi:Glyoxalase/bleomycin resistance protein/dioxygenase [Cladochytrium replicatum]|nr:Glyoxalase/bleomycin resistance protein/dioxygenase [Cladochytrium replicatum]
MFSRSLLRSSHVLQRTSVAAFPSRAMSATPNITPFHYAFPVDDLEKARAFYVGVLGCQQGREDPGKWTDYNLFNHQIVAHKIPDDILAARKTQNSVIGRNHVDGHQVPIPHFGVVLEWNQFHDLVDRVKAAGVKLEIEPYIRFKGLPGEQATMFFYDPAGNALEFKSFKDPSKLFATQ